ncbi:MAG: hypothetical protein ACE5FT_04360 [Candidatus Nanoarchaeia archaeon]
MRIFVLIVGLMFGLLIMGGVQAFHLSEDDTTIRGNFTKRYRSLEQKHRYGECHWEVGKGTVCSYEGEELPYYRERVIQTAQGRKNVRDLATSVTPWWEAPRSITRSFTGNFTRFPSSRLYIDDHRHHAHVRFTGRFG